MGDARTRGKLEGLLPVEDLLSGNVALLKGIIVSPAGERKSPVSVVDHVNMIEDVPSC